ncbi:septum formation initiator family protein [Thermoflexus hugenholtzii]|jgi:Septum formation initiator.|uniref:Cell division protein FtsB n=1 Tax=Thermoflexus hugenholtzii JAD2 TaxID=877466 RepID=A0A212RJK4_9CHLR|nr:septum formation initiator family protein [Thermoflexus hugenholtzii]SNB72510.1 Cell division protein FtsB [Thermoflexus hugenholtzii JAD2]
MRRWLDRIWRWGVRLTVLAALLALAHIAWENLEIYRQRVERAERLRAAIATEQARATRLAEQARYVQSEEFVARWARLEAGMVRPNETPYRLSWTPSASPPPSPPTPTPTPLPWQAWWMRLQGR